MASPWNFRVKTRETRFVDVILYRKKENVGCNSTKNVYILSCLVFLFSLFHFVGENGKGTQVWIFFCVTKKYYAWSSQVTFHFVVSLHFFFRRSRLCFCYLSARTHIQVIFTNMHKYIKSNMINNLSFICIVYTKTHFVRFYLFSRARKKCFYSAPFSTYFFSFIWIHTYEGRSILNGRLLMVISIDWFSDFTDFNQLIHRSWLNTGNTKNLLWNVWNLKKCWKFYKIPTFQIWDAA